MRPVVVSYSYKAEADLNLILDYFVGLSTIDDGQIIMDAISVDIQNLANTTLISGIKIEGLAGNYRRWMIYSKRYWVYFVRTGTIFQVLRVWPTKRLPLKPGEIKA